MPVNDFKVLSFDCYGTLIDWETGLLRALVPLRSRLDVEITDDQLLQLYAHHESAQQSLTPKMLYRELMANTYQRIAEQYDIQADWKECSDFGESIKSWSPFADTSESLQYLKRYYKLVILSNVDNESFAATNKVLGVTFDYVFTAQDIGTYKPNDNNFRFMVDTLAEHGIAKREILHTAQSLYHDVAPAIRIGLSTCWIDRQHETDGGGATPVITATPNYDFRFTTLVEMVEAHQQEPTDQ